MIKGKNILLGITGSIAAYKSAELVRLFKKSGASVKVVQTKSSVEFITPLTLSTLSENPVHIDMVDDNPNKIRIFALRSFGESLYHSITDASLEFGFKAG